MIGPALISSLLLWWLLLILVVTLPPLIFAFLIGGATLLGWCRIAALNDW